MIKKRTLIEKFLFNTSQTHFTVIAGPCSIESEKQLTDTAQHVFQNGAHILRGGVYKMRTSPNSFQGHGKKALMWLNTMCQNYPIITEITDPRQIPSMLTVVDIFQVGSRNMYNYELLKELSQLDRPVLLKRAFAATLSEWLKAAEYLAAGGLKKIALCERGIRTFETTTRNTLDLNSVAYLKATTQYPVIVDPSHGTGQSRLVSPMAYAALAAGADGIMVEVHPDPSKALSDGHQALDFPAFAKLMKTLKQVSPHFNRHLLTMPQLKENYGSQLTSP